MNRAECKATCRLHLTILNRRKIGPCKESWRRFCTLHTVPAVRQVVFADVQITIRQRDAVLPVDIGQSFAPIGLHKTDAASDWLLIKQHYLSKKGLPGVQVQKNRTT